MGIVVGLFGIGEEWHSFRGTKRNEWEYFGLKIGDPFLRNKKDDLRIGRKRFTGLMVLDDRHKVSTTVTGQL